MKTLKFLVAATLMAFTTGAFAQSVVIDENFQSFKEQGWKNDTICGFKKMDSKAKFKVSQAYNGNKVDFTFNKCAVAPTCDSKKAPMTEGVTKGYVEVNKKEGEIIISEQKYISTIEVGASATGDERGYALWKSVSGGAWTKVGDYLGIKGETTDAQYGFFNKININESNVSLKFTPTPCGKDDPKENQTFRIHNIKAFGK